jgi:hypothetical protein
MLEERESMPDEAEHGSRGLLQQVEGVVVVTGTEGQVVGGRYGVLLHGVSMLNMKAAPARSLLVVVGQHHSLIPVRVLALRRLLRA